jgi:hypothetical protein
MVSPPFLICLFILFKGRFNKISYLFIQNDKRYFLRIITKRRCIYHDNEKSVYSVKRWNKLRKSNRATKQTALKNKDKFLKYFPTFDNIKDGKNNLEEYYRSNKDIFIDNKKIFY